MHHLTILNNKEIKEILSQIECQWGAIVELNYGFLKNNQNKVFLVNREISEIDLDELRINSAGFYFCELERGIRLSIEGSQIVGPLATKNFLEISKDEAKRWLFGDDLPTSEEWEGFVIIKSGTDFFGTGKYTRGKILNYVAKERRISAV